MNMSKSDSHKPMVNVIIPAYNAGRWLPDCLRSLLRQSYKSWRAIVIDDGSTDSTARIVQEFREKDSRIELVNRPHEGVSAARNKGLEHADSRWILFLDADDSLHPRALKLLLQTANSTKAQIVVPRQHYGEIPDRFPSIHSLNPKVIDSKTALKKLLSRRGIEASMSGTLYLRKLFEEPYSLPFRRGRYEDLDLGYRIFERAQTIALLPAVLYYYRRHEGSFIRSLSPERFDVLDVTDRIYMHFRGTPLAKAAEDRRFGAHFNILMLLYSSREIEPAIEKRCLEVIKTSRNNSLRYSGVRLKNRVGALLAYGGRPMLKLLARINPQR